MRIFNDSLASIRRNDAAAGFAAVDFIKQEAAERLADRLLDIRQNFPLAVDLGCHTGQLRAALTADKVQQLVECDPSAQMLSQLPAKLPRIQHSLEHLPFANDSLDAILSVLSLHRINDLVGTLIQSRMALKPDGLFLAVLPGPKTLRELRAAIMQVAMETGKASQRLMPMVEVRDAGALLQRAGFALPVVDSELIHLTYRQFPTLLHEIKQMGEANILQEQFKGLTTARYWQAVEAAYSPDDKGLYPVTLELVFITAWKPDNNQQQPAARGSGKISMKAALGG